MGTFLGVLRCQGKHHLMQCYTTVNERISGRGRHFVAAGTILCAIQYTLHIIYKGILLDKRTVKINLTYFMCCGSIATLVQGLKVTLNQIVRNTA